MTQLELIREIQASWDQQAELIREFQRLMLLLERQILQYGESPSRNSIVPNP